MPVEEMPPRITITPPPESERKNSKGYELSSREKAIIENLGAEALERNDAFLSELRVQNQNRLLEISRMKISPEEKAALAQDYLKLWEALAERIKLRLTDFRHHSSELVDTALLGAIGLLDPDIAQPDGDEMVKKIKERYCGQ